MTAYPSETKGAIVRFITSTVPRGTTVWNDDAS